MERVRLGDMIAFRVLVDHYKDRSLSLANSIVKDVYLAEDVLQEVFMNVFTKIDHFKGEAAFATWLYRIVVNTSYNALKKQRRTTDISNPASNFTSETEAASDSLKVKDQQLYINMALQQLRADEALVLRLFYLCEFKIPEIEEITGFGRSKIKVDLHRGRNNLELELTKLLGDELTTLL